MNNIFGKLLLITAFLFSSASLYAQQLYEMPKGQPKTRWITFENQGGKKGAGGLENKGAKGHPFDEIKAGQTVTLMDKEGSGTIRRIWLTFSDQSPEMLRSMRIDMYWDGSDKPAVSVPIGDFFGVGLGQKVPFESALFSDPEGRSYNCFIPMPFKTHGRVTVTNESDSDLDAIFYEIDMLQENHPKELLYFHAYWNRENKTRRGRDFTILPSVQGKGRYLGTNIGVQTDSAYAQSWFGEGEVKIYLDGDSDTPTLVGTGTEDYIGTAYGQGTFSNMYSGSLIADPKKELFVFYRYHIPDPVYFYDDIRVTIQQIGGNIRDKVRKIAANGANLEPITVDSGEVFLKLLEDKNSPSLDDADFPKGWTNFYRSDDVSSTAYFYLDSPKRQLPPLQPLKIRTKDLPKKYTHK